MMKIMELSIYCKWNKRCEILDPRAILTVCDSPNLKKLQYCTFNKRSMSSIFLLYFL